MLLWIILKINHQKLKILRNKHIYSCKDSFYVGKKTKWFPESSLIKVTFVVYNPVVNEKRYLTNP